MWASRACVCRPAAGVVLRARPRLALGHAGPHVPASFASTYSTTAASSTPRNDCPFAILRIEPTEEFSKIKRAYFEAASRCHPDVMSAAALSKADPQATAQEFVLVTAAYQALQDPWTRTSLANTQPRAKSAQTRSAADRRDTHGDTTWRREQQEMEWCVRRDAYSPRTKSACRAAPVSTVRRFWVVTPKCVNRAGTGGVQNARRSWRCARRHVASSWRPRSASDCAG